MIRRTTLAFVLAVAAAALSLGIAGCQSPPFLRPAELQTSASFVVDSTAIVAQSRALSDAYVREDIPALVDVYTLDGVAAPGGRDFVQGHEDLTALWRVPNDVDVLRHASTPIEIEIDGDHAYDRGYYEGQVERDGEVLDPFRGTYVIVWERGADGVWRIAVDMWSSLSE